MAQSKDETDFTGQQKAHRGCFCLVLSLSGAQEEQKKVVSRTINQRGHGEQLKEATEVVGKPCPCVDLSLPFIAPSLSFPFCKTEDSRTSSVG